MDMLHWKLKGRILQDNLTLLTASRHILAKGLRLIIHIQFMNFIKWMLDYAMFHFQELQKKNTLI